MVAAGGGCTTTGGGRITGGGTTITGGGGSPPPLGGSSSLTGCLTTNSTGPKLVALPAASTTVPLTVCGPSVNVVVSIRKARAATVGHGCSTVYGSLHVPPAPAGAAICSPSPSIATPIEAMPPPSSLPSTTSVASPATVSPSTSVPDSSGLAGAEMSWTSTREPHRRARAGVCSGSSQTALMQPTHSSSADSTGVPGRSTTLPGSTGSLSLPAVRQSSGGSCAVEQPWSVRAEPRSAIAAAKS